MLADPIRPEPVRDVVGGSGGRATVRRELFPFDIDDADVVLATGGVGRVDQLLRDPIRPPRESADDVMHRRGVDHVGQAVAAEQQRGMRLERDLVHVDEIRIAGFVPIRTNVPVHLVPPRVAHRLELGDLAGIFPLADR